MPMGERKVRPANATKKATTRSSSTAKAGSARKPAVTKTTPAKASATKTASKQAAKTSAEQTASKQATRKSATAKTAAKTTASKQAARKTAAARTATNTTTSKPTAARKPAKTTAKQATKTAARKPAAKRSADTKTARKPAARKPAAKTAAGPTALSASLRCHLVMTLRHTEPFGAALTRALEALDPYEDSEEREAAALALVDAVPLPPELLNKVTEFAPSELEDITLLWPYWDGESDPFALDSLAELLALPNLERLANASALPDPPLDAGPLLALPRLRHVEMWDSSYCYNGSRYALWTNKKARAQLEAAGFRLVSPPASTPTSTWVFERS